MWEYKYMVPFDFSNLSWFGSIFKHFALFHVPQSTASWVFKKLGWKSKFRNLQVGNLIIRKNATTGKEHVLFFKAT